MQNLYPQAYLGGLYFLKMSIYPYQSAKAEISKLSPEQQELRALHERFAADQKRGVREAGGELIGKTNQLLKEGLNWPVADRQALATLVEAIFSYIGWGNKKKERKEKIAALRG